MKRNDPFEELLRRYKGLLYTLCGRFRHKGLEANDLLQEATVALWRAREKLLAMPVGVQQAALVWKIGRNAAIDCLRRHRNYDELGEHDEPTTEDRSLLQELHDRIALLEEPDRTIVRLQLQGYSYEEIAAEVGMSEKNVSVRLVRVKDRLRKQMVR